jgi:organic hydroperoxide reductase OsmC/OhrA
VIELIWDKDASATVTGPSGASMTVGETSDFSPEDLTAVAAAACLMRTFLARARSRGESVLSYASTADVDVTRPGIPRIVIRCYVVTTEGGAPSEIEAMLRESLRLSPVCRMMEGSVECDADVRRLCGLGLPA